MSKKYYVNDRNIQIAMSEYDEGIVENYKLYTENDTLVGTVTQIYDNEHGAGEQVYVVVR